MEKIENEEEFEYDHLQIDNESITESYIATVAMINTITKDGEEVVSLNSTMASRLENSAPNIKLPPISIPKFAGNELEWITFFDTFSALVDQNANIPKISKMHHLRDSLLGEAAKRISKLPASDANYDIAWNLLIEHYHNKRSIVNECLKSFIFQEPIKHQNAHSIRSLIDTTKEAMQSIETLDVDIEHWDPFIVYVLQTKLDKDTAIEWEKKLGGSKEIPEYSDMLDFLETQYRIVKTPTTSSNVQQSSTQKINATRVENNEKKKDFCEVCKGQHYILFCDTFKGWDVTQRKQFVNEKKLCVVCMKKHEVQSCKSKFRCKICQGLHSTKLHEDTTSTSSSVNSINMPDFSANVFSNGNKLLATAIVKVQDRHGIKQLLRVFIDQGSEGAIISERAAQLLSLPRIHENIQITGIDDAVLGTSKGYVKIKVESVHDSEFELDVNAMIMRSILSTRKYNAKLANLKHLAGLTLADPDFMNPSNIDLLFGVDIYGLIIKNGLRKGKPYEPIAQNSSLGWLVFGAISPDKNVSVRVNAISISEQLQRFWDSDTIPAKPILSEEHQQCVDHFNKHFKRFESGKMMVSLPFNFDPKDKNLLGNSRYKATQRLYQMEKKFKRQPEFYRRYREDMQGYIDVGHMSLCDESNDGYFLPHHAVTRESSTTTKQRTVFDGSATSSNGFSLNDRLLNGPTIQPDLFDIFIRWRIHKIAIVSDIEKMYRQILVAPEDRKYQKILWRFSETDPIETYYLNTIVFGLKPSPFLAISCTFALADAEKENFPNASEKIKTDLYVDDCISGSESKVLARRLVNELYNLGRSGKLPFRKWASNDDSVLQDFPQEHKANASSFQLNKHEAIKTLGINWLPQQDLLQFSLDLSTFFKGENITKRKLLSDASKLFDPCGLLAPIILKPKILMQKVWHSGIDWDNRVDAQIQTEWNNYKAELPLIETMKLERWFHTSADSIKSLHGFCDSSEPAYGAAIYIVQTSNSITTSNLICSKTRVAPLEPMHIHRLELCSAVLLATLMNKVATNLSIPRKSVFLWTDSAVTWTWLQAHPSNWKSYVAHRVHEIQKLFPAEHWRHVRTHENPADIASRGAFASQLINNSLWFHGPSWLVLDKNQWPKIQLPLPSGINLETRSKIHVTVTKTAPIEMSLLLRFSKLTSLLHVTARLLRVTQLYRKKKQGYRKEIDNTPSEYVTFAEFQQAKMAWVKYIQSLHFAKEIADLQSNKFVNEKSALKSLNPQLSKDGISVVDGRLRYANLSERQRYPMILPPKSHFTNLVIDAAHTSTLHGTIHLTLARTRQEFWILNARNNVKSFIHKCMTCFRQNPTPLNQLMAPLPTIKTTPARAFIHCGLDFAGPIEIKSGELRNSPSIKTYICVFVCMASKACHLELVGDLSTQRFILALRRLVGRRGICKHIYCDHGTNFEGANNELPRLLLQSASSVSTEIKQAFVPDGIEFHFNPPRAPNWGGQWESYVKLTKHHLRRMTTSRKLTFEEMYTLLVQIEACVNSRPLCSITSDPNDLNPLTPSHLLIGEPLNAIPEPSLLSLKDQTLDRFQLIQKNVQLFWKRFSTEYLHTLHPRSKWTQRKEELQGNDLVVIVEENMPPTKWWMAR
ncbi:uncharacterized protein LOC129568954, partial [Sitodiplosis mosellana]|uniref:uncharacterized protein LOC129568954 n=1 Tax=Sitodiplosis mosellana TaxID=263140 RepID=UPI0024440994